MAAIEYTIVGTSPGELSSFMPPNAHSDANLHLTQRGTYATVTLPLLRPREREGSGLERSRG